MTIWKSNILSMFMYFIFYPGNRSCLFKLLSNFIHDKKRLLLYMGGRSNIEQVFFLSIFPVSVILIGYRHLRAIEPHTKIHLIKEALLSCIIGHCARKRKTDNSNLKKFKDYRNK